MDSLSAELYAPTHRPNSGSSKESVLELWLSPDRSWRSTTWSPTRQRDLEWEFTVSINGEEWRIPPEVVDRIIRDRELIIRAQRKDRGKEQAEARKSQVGNDREKTPLDLDPEFGQKPWPPLGMSRATAGRVHRRWKRSSGAGSGGWG